MTAVAVVATSAGHYFLSALAELSHSLETFVTKAKAATAPVAEEGGVAVKREEEDLGTLEMRPEFLIGKRLQFWPTLKGKKDRIALFRLKSKHLLGPQAKEESVRNDELVSQNQHMDRLPGHVSWNTCINNIPP